MQINVLVIGSGKMAQAYLTVLKSFQNFNILGAYSRNQEKLREFCFKNKIYNFLNYQQIKKYKKKIRSNYHCSISSKFNKCNKRYQRPKRCTTLRKTLRNFFKRGKIY